MAYKSLTPKIVTSGSGATVTLTAAQTDSVILMDRAAGIIFTLPAATAALKGTSYKFVVKTSVTSNNYSVVGASNADLFYGGVALTNTTAGNAISAGPNGSSNYQCTMNGTTTGGLKGTVITATCLGLNAWLIDGIVSGSGTLATPFAG